MDDEARIIYALCIVLTLPFIIVSIARERSVGANATICMLVAALGIAGFISDWRKRAHFPRARLRRPKF